MIPEALTTYANVIAARSTTVPQARIEHLIGVVSLAIQKELSRPFGYRRATTAAPERYQGTGDRSLFVKRWPIRAIEEIKENGSTITDWLNDPDFLAGGRIYREAGWPRRAAAFPDLTRDPNPGAVNYSITLAYTAGYILPQYHNTLHVDHNPAAAPADLPPDVEEACIQAVFWNAGDRPTSGLKAERTPGGWQQEWATGGSGATKIVLPPETLDLLEPYRARWWP